MRIAASKDPVLRQANDQLRHCERDARSAIVRAHFGGGWSVSTFVAHGFSGGATGLSFANTFAALGIRKDLINPQLLNGLPGWLRVIAAIQTILGIVLLFLFGLGIRNRFRMK
jgi:hypothetical protein